MILYLPYQEYKNPKTNKIDYLPFFLPAKGGTIGPHGESSIPQVVNVCYGTGDPPSADTVPEGTLYVKYSN